MWGHPGFPRTGKHALLNTLMFFYILLYTYLYIYINQMCYLSSAVTHLPPLCEAVDGGDGLK